MSSIAFDPAADYYDRTRALDPGVQAAVIAGLLAEIGGRGPCLEIGVGTGRIALDLMRAGVPMAGIDLSAPMLARLVAKAGGAAPFPLAVADATALPFPARAFGSAVACHVLHLVQPWRAAVEELLRVVRPGGVVLVDIGGAPPGIAADLRRRFFAETSVGVRDRPGLTDLSDLDALMTGRGLAARSAAAGRLALEGHGGTADRPARGGHLRGLLDAERRGARGRGRSDPRVGGRAPRPARPCP